MNVVTRNPDVRHTHWRLAIAVVIASVSVLMGSAVASAHEHRELADGAYGMEVGFFDEPAVQDEINGLFLRVTEGLPEEGEAGATPAAGEEEEEGGPGVEGLEDTLQAEVTFGTQTRELTLRPVADDPGTYRATFIPTAAGAYTFRIFGTINDVTIDESFTGGPETFAEISERAGLMFPPSDQSARTASAVSDAQDSAGSASTLAIVALVLGAIGAVAGVYALVRSSRPGQTVTPATLDE